MFCLHHNLVAIQFVFSLQTSYIYSHLIIGTVKCIIVLYVISVNRSVIICIHLSRSSYVEGQYARAKKFLCRQEIGLPSKSNPCLFLSKMCDIEI